YGNLYQINVKEQIIGWVEHPKGNRRSFLWDHGKRRYFEAPKGYERFVVAAINDRGQVVGHAEGPPRPNQPPAARAFLWENGRLRDLGALGHDESTAEHINNKGQVIGWLYDARPAATYHTFLWENGAMRDLGPGTARSINDRGQIVGS